MIELMQEALAALRGSIERVERQGDQAEARAAAAEAHAAALRDHVAAMREQLADAHAALQAAAEAGARTERAERDKQRAEAALNAERARADGLHEQIVALRIQLTARQEVVDAAEAIRQADDARLARGRWARLRAAGRGE
jgi:hypothetical protein